MSVTFLQTVGSGGGANQEWTVVNATGGTTVTAAASQAIYVDTTAGPVTVNLPLASANLGFSIKVKKITGDVNAVTVGSIVGDTIDAQASWNLGLLSSGVEVTAGSSSNWYTS